MKKMMYKMVIISTLLLLVAMGASSALAAELQEAVNTTYVIYPDDLQGWNFSAESGSGMNSFTPGPDTPPLGIGSVQLQISGPEDGYVMYTYGWGGTLMSELTILSYSTYHDPSSLGSDTQLPALVINIDYDISDSDVSWQGRIIYDPYLTPENTPVKGSWQTWDTLGGVWWATEDPDDICPQSNPCLMSDLISQYPNIGTYAGIGVKIGSGWENGFIGNMDAFIIGDSEAVDTFDFEPSLVSDLDLWQTTEPGIIPWELVPGSFTDGFNMLLDTSVPYYYLETNSITVIQPLEDGYHSFYVQTYPTGYFDYWAGRGVVSGASDWQAVMWEIINGNQPIFFLKVDGTDYMLVDGLTYLLGGGDEPLRIEGSYLPGAYTFVGTLTDTLSNTDDVEVGIIFNDIPVAEDMPFSTDEDAAYPMVLSVADIYPGTLTWTIISGPAHGALSGTAPNLTYTPAANYYGADSFTFKANDGDVDSNTATVSITVTAVNDAPVANGQAVTTNEDTPKGITLTANDAESDPLTWTIVSGPAHGTLSGTGSARTYTPTANYHGSDSFTFKVNDGKADSNTATVNITVVSVNDAPVAADQPVTVNEDTPISLTLVATDVEVDPLTWTIVSQPSHGELSGTAPDLIYTPDANYHGADSFTFKVNDGKTDSNTATVSIMVTSVNDVPVADGQVVGTDEDTATDINLTATDADGDDLTWIIVDGPTHGTLSGSAPALTYTPDPGFKGQDSFTFKVNDGTTDSIIATVTINVAQTKFYFYIPFVSTTP